MITRDNQEKAEEGQAQYRKKAASPNPYQQLLSYLEEHFDQEQLHQGNGNPFRAWLKILPRSPPLLPCSTLPAPINHEPIYLRNHHPG